MNHPQHEQWMAFLYGELPPSEAANLNAHLAACPECERQVAAWRKTMTTLNAWPDATAPRRFKMAEPVLKWGLAAAVVLTLGFGAGRLSAPASPSPEALRAALRPALRQEIQNELKAGVEAALAAADSPGGAGTNSVAGTALGAFADQIVAKSRGETQRYLVDFSQGLAAARETDHQTTLTLFQGMQRRHQDDLSNLRMDLETVALVADVRLRHTQQELGQLASYSQPEAPFDASSGEAIPNNQPKQKGKIQ